jgi:murein DD-endopeptidase MepM/ murein hydrolase activator NlpD
VRPRRERLLGKDIGTLIGRPTARRRWLLGGLVAIAGMVSAAVAVGLLDPRGGSEPRAAVDEVRLDRLGPIRPSADDDEPAPKGPRATVVQAVPPGGVASNRDGGGEGGDSGREEPPRRVLAENAKLRRELDHLKALEAERRRVSRRLTLAGAVYDGPVRLGRGGLAWPVGGSLVSPFGQRWGRLHAGIDIAARTGTVIHAAANGLVVIGGPTGGYGNYVCVQHTRRLTTCYAHLSRFLTKRGTVVRQGEPIGLVGCTGHCFGDHLHFETWVGGRPVDPMRYF